MSKVVRVKQLVDTDELDHDDRRDRPAGTGGKGSSRDYYYGASRDEDKALDWFHDTVPIANLDDFACYVVEDSKSQSQEHYEAVAAICRCGDCHCCERAANRLTTGKN